MLRGFPPPATRSRRPPQPPISQPLSPSPYGQRNISEAEKSRIYDEWIGAGKPHNLVCSLCRHPDNLMPCESCCRAYHAACLSLGEDSNPLNGQFYCPSCKRNQWDQSPPQFGGVTPSSTGSSTSPAAGMGSPANAGSPYIRPHSQPGSAGWPAQIPIARQPPQPQSSNVDVWSSQYDVLSRARDFLFEYGHFPPTQEFRLEFLLKLGSMIAQVESHQTIQQVIHDLQEENASLRSSNGNLRAMLGPNVSAQLPMAHPGPSLPLPNHSGDPSEKSWDRIVTDLI
ncbi:hypothetical protein FE257_002839 [Aspergillus nanangensis]|uniref:PHD-type domain-containing protein n=1 Tax=Aspergillus nanangensis TaxID=2582783 RepID=A0AAD4CSW7_ASPNN|nr:hypothetical protein FE257_002839 [Aspergillus nanangensis]